MYPNYFIRSLWQMTVREEVFVAMSFDQRFKERWDNVYVPACKEVGLKPVRVDDSKTGDSILTDIMDGICHAKLILADVTTIERGESSLRPYRNGNVMYEVGVAMSTRQPAEVIIVRSDKDEILFDVRVMPHSPINFDDATKAKLTLVEIMKARLNEIKYYEDARIHRAYSALSAEETRFIRMCMTRFGDVCFSVRQGAEVNFDHIVAIPRLLDKSIIRLFAIDVHGGCQYNWTPFGQIIGRMVMETLLTPKERMGRRNSPDLSYNPDATDDPHET